MFKRSAGGETGSRAERYTSRDHAGSSRLAALGRLLVVAPDATRVRTDLARLEAEGFTVVLAATFDAARALCDEARWDLVVVDLMTKGENGLELARQLRARHPDLAVALASPYPLGGAQLARAGCGEIACIGRPYAVADVVRALRGVTCRDAVFATMHRWEAAAPLDSKESAR